LEQKSAFKLVLKSEGELYAVGGFQVLIDALVESGSVCEPEREPSVNIGCVRSRECCRRRRRSRRIVETSEARVGSKRADRVSGDSERLVRFRLEQVGVLRRLVLNGVHDGVVVYDAGSCVEDSFSVLVQRPCECHAGCKIMVLGFEVARTIVCFAAEYVADARNSHSSGRVAIRGRTLRASSTLSNASVEQWVEVGIRHRLDAVDFVGNRIVL